LSSPLGRDPWPVLTRQERAEHLGSYILSLSVHNPKAFLSISYPTRPEGSVTAQSLTCKQIVKTMIGFSTLKDTEHENPRQEGTAPRLQHSDVQLFRPFVQIFSSWIRYACLQGNMSCCLDGGHHGAPTSCGVFPLDSHRVCCPDLLTGISVRKSSKAPRTWD